MLWATDEEFTRLILADLKHHECASRERANLARGARRQ